MATKRMLVDAIHPEETRVVVTSGNRLEEFDFESASRRQLRGNIYLAKVTRVEPSLQAAFIEYGGNRHGFLAFSEIHPDYYQIPVADREALLRDEEAAEAENGDNGDAVAEPPEAEADSQNGDNGDAVAEPPEAEADSQNGDDGADDNNGHIEQTPANSEPVESVGSGDVLEEMPERRKPTVRRNAYKIQEVIKRRQVMLVQVVKEERGNKGAALTTYLSLAGRYSVLMPNTARGGGISRKITNTADRKRLKDIVGDLDVPPGQGIILRTAGASRTRAEVKRDFDYLQRLWENVRTLTLKSTAPCLVYEEGSLIKRTIRDLYSKEIDELLVAGAEAHREAKDFMRMIMPSHAKNVQLYTDDQPIFSRYNVEGQLDSMFSPQVTLPSGGYLVINPTEALVSIDVNSGRSTKEHNIEDTALQTNLEAAEEVARQLRLRDLAGLIVIDFIDMMENRSNRAVERKLKDCLKNDRARIQVGRISHFGLMEMSRQRIRFGVVESSTHKCQTCQGTGLVRSVESLALMVMRAVEDHVLRKSGQSINVRMPTDVALYILNSKRATLNALESRYNLSITVVADDHVGPSHYAIERGEARLHDGRGQAATTHVRVDTAAMDEAAAEPEEDTEDEAAHDGGERQGRRRRRRRGRGERGDEGHQRQTAESTEAESEGAAETAPTAAPAGDEDDEPRRRRRRGRRGGRRNRRPAEETFDRIEANGDTSAATAADGDATAAEEPVPETAVAGAADEAVVGVEPETPVEKPRRARRTRKSPDAESTVQDEPVPAAAEAEAAVAAPAEAVVEAAPPARPKRTRKPKKAEAAPPAEAGPVESAPSEPIADPAPVAKEKPKRRRKAPPAEDEIVVSSTATPAEEEQPKPKKAGWWQRGFLGG